MPIEIANRMIELAGIISIGVMMLAGMRIWRGGRHQRDDAAQREQLEHLTNAIRNLHDQVEGLQQEVTELGERLDFTERVLTRGNRVPDQVVETTPV
jgi:uncharacterized protein YlxW (UPF0749 family)